MIAHQGYNGGGVDGRPVRGAGRRDRRLPRLAQQAILVLRIRLPVKVWRLPSGTGRLFYGVQFSH